MSHDKYKTVMHGVTETI